MGIDDGFDYMQARLQARHGMRLSDNQWRQLEMIPSFSVYLRHARQTGLAFLLQNMGEQADIHEVEALLNHNFIQHIEQVASFSPVAYRPALLWTRLLFTLMPQQQPWLDGQASWPNLHPTWQENTFGAEALLQQAKHAQKPLLEMWYEQGRRLWPQEKSSQQELDDFIDLWQKYGPFPSSLMQFSETPSPLENQLLLFFRRHSHRAGAVLAHLLLAAQDYRRLRGALAKRLLFNDKKAGSKKG